jgi:hypothetical protein
MSPSDPAPYLGTPGQPGPTGPRLPPEPPAIAAPVVLDPASPAASDSLPVARVRWWRFLFGGPRNLAEAAGDHRLTLVAFLAWVGLGADALSSSAYGPEEAFKAIHGHSYLAIGLAVATALTVLVISAAYSKLIESFPNGGGYGVASRLLGARVGAVSGCALLVDYVLTITISIASMGDALFSLLPPHWQEWKFDAEFLSIVGLIGVNLRGVRESIIILAPIFMVFIVTHAIMIAVGLSLHASSIVQTSGALAHDFVHDLHDQHIGLVGMLLIFLNAYSLGGGTYTGIEAVSNSLPLMREPRLQTAKHTMIYLATSLAATAGGLIICYLLWSVDPQPDKTMNATLAERVAAHLPFSQAFVIVTLAAEGALLLVAAQAGFLGGPRVMANMAIDSWFPHRFAALSERLTTENGIIFMGLLSLGALVFTHGDVDVIVVMYSINVFLTFSLTMYGMVLMWWRHRRSDPVRWQRLALFGFGAALCSLILVVTVVEKFSEGGSPWRSPPPWSSCAPSSSAITGR